MTLEQLKQIVPTPLSPLERVATGDWLAAEHTLGFTFPDDYKALVEAYGTGAFNDFLAVFGPVSDNKHLNLLEVQHPILDAYRTLHTLDPRTTPFAAYPEPGGLFPWGRTDNGDVFYWRTEGDPNGWPTVLFESRHAFYEEYEQSMTELLAGLLDGSIASTILSPPHEFGDEPFFESQA